MSFCQNVVSQVAGSEIDSEAQGQGGHRGLSGRYSVTSYGSGGLSHKESKTRRTTPSLNSGTFSQSLINLTQVLYSPSLTIITMRRVRILKLLC